MEVSTLTVSPEHLRFTKMSRARKTKLRKQNIIDLINSKPYGTQIQLSDFAAVCSFTVSSANQLLKRMVKSGRITKIALSPKRFAYSVNSEVQVTKPAVAIPVHTAPSEPAHNSNPIPVFLSNQPTNKVESQVPRMSELLDLARDFAWTKNSDSLREFVEWVGKK
jgi:hypothetical protein